MVRETSSVGPLPGSWSMCISSAMTNPTDSIHLLPWRIRESAFSDVATITSESESFLSSESRSPMLMPTDMPRWENLSKSSLFSDASAFRGTM